MCSSLERNSADFDENELLDNQDDPEFTQLTEMVRNHYMRYLEKQLMDNFRTCYVHKSVEDSLLYLSEDETMRTIKQTAKILEDKALSACMIAQFYQRAMIKIIAIVRRSTEENRLLQQMKSTISQPVNTNTEMLNKQTQTEEVEAGLSASHSTSLKEKSKENSSFLSPDNHLNNDQDMTLDEKIELFQNHLKTEQKRPPIVIPPFQRSKQQKSMPKNIHKTSRKDNNSHHKVNRHNHHRPYKEISPKSTSPTDTVITPTETFQVPLEDHQMDILTNTIEKEEVIDKGNANDQVALELARLFSEEKTELDEIFGIDPNEEPDDPQICKILKEIEQAKVSHEGNSPKQAETEAEIEQNGIKININPSISRVVPTNAVVPSKHTDLSKSLWPCELFMHRRKLTDSLERLIDEDLRWYDVMKWKFLELFGEDSDDEFAPCSPSIELDEILMGSCVKRISPWIVKHLMKPMNDGLIGNRFIFKKLAKHMARSIITENQYPDESIIKGCVENYFCLYQSVLTLDDLQDVPSISEF